MPALILSSVSLMPHIVGADRQIDKRDSLALHDKQALGDGTCYCFRHSRVNCVNNRLLKAVMAGNRFGASACMVWGSA